MIKILFCCHGNICRSPMAEFVMKDMVSKAGVAHRFLIDSCAASREEIGSFDELMNIQKLFIPTADITSSMVIEVID